MNSDWWLVVSFISVGLILMLLEFILIPGTTVVGFIGGLLAIVGVYFGYEDFGVITGSIILFVSLFVSGGGLYASMKFKVYKKFSLNENSEGSVNKVYDEFVKIGDEGVSLSALRPVGEAEFNERTYEVSTLGQFVEAKRPIKVISIENNKIFVDLI